MSTSDPARDRPIAKVSASLDWVHAQISLPTPEEAIDLAARFPKSVRVNGVRYYRDIGQPPQGAVTFRASLEANANNGGTNETGLRRLRAYLKACARLGIEVRYETPAANSLTAAEFDQLTEGAR